MKKTISLALLGMAFVLTGCGDNSQAKSNAGATSTSGNDTKSTETSNKGSENAGTTGSTLRMESEYTNLTGIVGGGISGSPSGLDLIQANKDASNGYYIGSTHAEGFALTYTFNSSVAATDVTVALGLGNELGTALTYDSKSLTVAVNGTNMTFSSFTVKVSGYKAYALGTVSLNAGENKIVTTVVGPNEYCNNSTGGPEFDYVELSSKTTTLTWSPIESNLPEDE